MSEWIDVLKKDLPLMDHNKEVISPLVFEKYCGDGDGLGVTHNEQVLYAKGGMFLVGEKHVDNLVKCRLVEVEHKDIKINHTYFVTNKTNFYEDLEILTSYCKWLGNIRVRWLNNNIVHNAVYYLHWYKLEVAYEL